MHRNTCKSRITLAASLPLKQQFNIHNLPFVLTATVLTAFVKSGMTHYKFMLHGHVQRHDLMCFVVPLLPHISCFLCTGDAYYIPYSFLFISNKFCKGGSGATRAIKFLYALEWPEQDD